MRSRALRASLRPRAIKALDAASSLTRVQNAIGGRYGGFGSIIMWHSVVDSPRHFLNQDIRCSSDYLERTLSWCVKNNVAVVDLAEAMRRVRERQSGKFVVMTFDDGYRDNATIALPIFEKYGLPFAVYPVVRLIQRDGFYWWGGLVEMIKRQQEIRLDGLGVLSTSSAGEKVRALAVVSRWVEDDVETRSEALRRPLAMAGVDERGLMENETLSLDDLVNLSRSPLVTIGSHSVSHRYLKPLTDNEVDEEVRGSKKWLEEVLQQPVEHFSYPHGDSRACGHREARFAESAGYRTAITTRRGNIFPEHVERPFMLPRGGVNPNRESIASFRAQLSGLPRFVASKGGPPIDGDTVLTDPPILRDEAYNSPSS